MLASLLAACAGRPLVPPGPPAAGTDYTIELDPTLDQLTVTLCFRAPPPSRLIPGTAAGATLMSAVALLQPGRAPRPLTLRAGGLDLGSEVGVGDCVRWTGDARAVSAASEPRQSAWAGDSRFLWPALWLWRPQRPAPDWAATVRFQLPPDVVVSSAWTPDDTGRYGLEVSVLQTRGRVVVGRFPQWIQEVDGSKLEVSAVGLLPDRAVLEPWVQAAAAGVAAIYGGFPRPRAQVVLLGAWGRSVVFGEAQRGGGPGVTLWVGQGATPATLKADWTLAHELFHLGLPRVAQGDAWFAEGVTQYYTHIAQARAGVLSLDEAWSELHDGFMRGRGSDAGESVWAESQALDRRHNYWWVYWGGAAWALRLDLALRAQGHSLDEVVRHWQRHPCCLPARPAEALLAEADALVGAAVATPLVTTLLRAPEFPDLSAAYAFLGLDVVDRSTVRLSPAAPGAAEARAIMGAVVETPPKAR